MVSTPAEIRIEVVYATLELQKSFELRLKSGVTARAAACESNLDRYFEGLNLASVALGVWGVRVADALELRDGDRLELYRPLDDDPRDRRRRKAREGETMTARRS